MRLLLAALPLSLQAVPAAADAPPPPPPAAVTPYADIRYRLEVVDQAGLPRDATASTLRVRAGVRTAPWHGLSAVIEGEAIAVIGAATYNDTVNGKTGYPVVADPSDVLLNQAFVRWNPVSQLDLSAGRQAINLDNQRWVGSVGWRQDDQTLDAARLTLKPAPGLSADYLYAWRVNRVFGPDSPQGIWHGTAIHSVRGAYAVKGFGTVSAYGLWLDIPASPASSSRTLGARIAGERKLGGSTRLLYAAEYARQKDYGPNPARYDLAYVLVEPGIGQGPFTLRGGFERLGGNGTAAVQTPLATLHAFNGWADKFLVTPANGLRDLYVDAGWKAAKGPVKGLALRAVWHEFNADRGGLDYGREWDGQASYPVGKHFTVLAKVARYEAHRFATDTTKVWLAIEARF